MADRLPQKLINQIEAFAGAYLSELAPPRDRGTTEKYITMVTTSPTASAALEIKTLNLQQRMGIWQHKIPKIHEFIEYNWAQMDGSYKAAIAELATCLPLGWAASEFALREPVNGQWLIESLYLIPPKYVRSFEGRDGRVSRLKYSPTHGAEVNLPYECVVHVINRRHVAALTDYPLYGIGDCRLALAAFDAWKIISAEMIIAGQRQATPILFGKEDDNGWAALLKEDRTPVLDKNGQPVKIPAAEHLKEQMASLNKNGGVIAGGLNSDVRAINQETDGRFFLEMLKYFDKLIMRSFLIPNTTIEEGVGGLGNAGLASAQLENMRLMLDSLAQEIRQELTEKVIRPLIAWEFGEQETYGEWLPPQETDEERIDLLNALNTAFSGGIYSTADLLAVNRHRELSGIPPIEATEDNAAVLSRAVDYWRKAS